MEEPASYGVSLSEQEASQKKAIDLFREMGYQYLTPDEALALRDGKESRVLLTGILKPQLMKLNSYVYQRLSYSFSAKNIEQAAKELDEPLMDGLINASERVFLQLRKGRSFEEETPGGRRSFSFRYIDWVDWENPERNVFHVTEEFSVATIGGKADARRPDIVLFVNGIPLAVIECKKASIGVKEAISQHIRNQDENEIPDLFKFAQILVASHKNEMKYGTTGTPLKFWHVWHEEDEAVLQATAIYVTDRIPTAQDQAMVSLLHPRRLLELVRLFILYDAGVKKICRYQQYFAVKSALERVKHINRDGIREGGLVWHTQGSGKSLTMVMLAHALATEPDVPNPRIVVVTDRIDLDKQIRDTFADTGLEPIRATTGAHLVELLRSGKGSIITTVINKFESVLGAKLPPVDDANLFVLVDESHRSQYGEMSRRMRDVFPRACYIGFTGTPLFKPERSSVVRFGGFIHKYTIDKAVKDGAVVPLLYEGRMVEQSVKRKVIDAHLDMVTAQLTPNQREDLKRKWSRFERLASSEQRLFMIAADIHLHFLQSWKGTGFNAMLATNSKAEAVRYKDLFDTMGGLRAEVVISAPDDREGYEEVGEAATDIVQNFWQRMLRRYGDGENYEDALKKEFKDGEVDLLIVVDKLLTGFDAPLASVLYVDKSLRDHGLLQAIARVNRVSEGKDFGYIIDYRGLLGELDKAMTSYTEAGLDRFEEEDLVGTIMDIREIVNDVKQSHARLWDLFAPICNKRDAEEYEVFLANEADRDEFYQRFNRFNRSLGVVAASDRAAENLASDRERYKHDLKFFAELRKNVKLRYADGIDFKEYEGKLQKLLDNHVSADGMMQLTPPVDIMDSEAFGKQVERLAGPRAKADMIRSHLARTISERYDEDPAYFKSFSQRIDDVLRQYRENRISEAEYLGGMKDALAKLRAGENSHEIPPVLRDKPHAKAMFGVLRESLPEGAYHGRAVPISLQVADILDKHCKVDWENSPDAHNQIAQDIDDLFFEIQQETGEVLPFETIDKVIDQVKIVALKRYATR